MSKPGSVLADGSIQSTDPRVRLICGLVIILPEYLGYACHKGWRAVPTPEGYSTRRRCARLAR